MLREDELQAVDGFRFANRCPSRSEAIRHLIKLGLSQAATHRDPETTTAG